MYPQVFHIGLPKTGTTSIQSILNNDARINNLYDYSFCTPEYWSAPPINNDANKVSIISNENLILQAGNFCKFILTLSRIAQKSPNAKIILTIREQRDLLESRYKYEIRHFHKGYHKSFHEWLTSGAGMDYISATMYNTIYTAINAFFPSNQIFFLLFEDLKADPEFFYKSLYDILDLPIPENHNFHQNKNRNLTEKEILIIKRLNKYKLFSKRNRFGAFESKVIEKIVSKFKDKNKKYNEFRWETCLFHKSIDSDFAFENNQLISKNIISKEKFNNYNYLL